MKFKYPYKVWLSTIITSPFVLMLLLMIINSGSLAVFIESFVLILFMILYGLVLSVPALVLFGLLFSALNNVAIRAWFKKLILALAGVSFIWTTFYFFDRDFIGNANLESLAWPAIYSVVLLISAFIFKMNDNNKESKTMNLPTHTE